MDYSELMAFKENLENFAKNDCQVMGVTCDNLITIKNWMQLEPNQGGTGGPVSFPIISDNRLEVARLFGVKGSSGMPVRATFILDKNRNVRHSSVYPNMVGRSVEKVLRILRSIKEIDQQAGEEFEVYAPPGWKEGDDLIVDTLEGKKEYYSKMVPKNEASRSQVEENRSVTKSTGMEVVAVVTSDERGTSVIVCKDDTTLQAGDMITINGQVAEVFGFPSANMFSVSAVSASAGDMVYLHSRFNHTEEEDIQLVAGDGERYDWDKEFEWLAQYFKFQSRKKRVEKQ